MGKWVDGEEGVRDERREVAIENHRNYWAEQGGTPNIDVFGPGFNEGWSRANWLRAEHRDEPKHDTVQQYAEECRGEEQFGVPREDPDIHWEWVHGFWQGMVQAWDAGHWEEEEQHEVGGDE